jgi:hypothetical protein
MGTSGGRETQERALAGDAAEKPEEGRSEANGPVAQIAFPSISTLPSPFRIAASPGQSAYDPFLR